MTNLHLARSYLRKATDRLAVLDLLASRGAHSDVVREAIHFIPTEEYTDADSRRAIEDAQFVVAQAQRTVGE